MSYFSNDAQNQANLHCAEPAPVAGEMNFSTSLLAKTISQGNPSLHDGLLTFDKMLPS
eukprot:UN02674